jgi:ribose transport system substrate-binding protein
MPTLTSSLLQKFGDKWTHSLAINDLYFDFMGPTLASAGKKGDAGPKAVSAGDGSEAAYQRIRSKRYQAGTVPEPLNMQGWQIVDELNRSFAKQPWSGYVPKVHLVTAANVGKDGGPKNLFDPDNGYRDQYKGIWGRK